MNVACPSREHEAICKTIKVKLEKNKVQLLAYLCYRLNNLHYRPLWQNIQINILMQESFEVDLTADSGSIKYLSINWTFVIFASIKFILR